MMIRLVVFLFCGLLSACAGDSLSVKTNYYSVGGTTAFEIREEIGKKKPWKGDSDAFTSWQVNWSFTSVSSDSDCALRTIEVKTEIVLTLPQWTPADASEEVKKRWNNYHRALLSHEEGHKRLALAAAAEVKKRLSQIKPALNCATLETTVSGEANKIIRNYQEREKSYDERTRNGRSQGAVFP